MARQRKLSPERKAFMKDLKLVYKADTEELALEALDSLEETWKSKYPSSKHHGEITGHSFQRILNIWEK